MRDRCKRILDEPLSGQEAGKDGDYLVAEVYHRMRKGYVLSVSYMERKTETFQGVSRTIESFTLFSSGKQVMVVADFGPYSAKKLKAASRAAHDYLPQLKAEVLALRTANIAKREQEKRNFAKRG